MNNIIVEELLKIRNLMEKNPLNQKNSFSQIEYKKRLGFIFEQGYSAEVIKKFQLQNLQARAKGQEAPHNFNFMDGKGNVYLNYVTIPPELAKDELNKLSQYNTTTITSSTPKPNLDIQQIQSNYLKQSETPGFTVDPCGVPEIGKQKFTSGNLIPRNDVDYRQETTQRATIYTDSQVVMECWDIRLFDNSSDALNSMFIDKEIYIDKENGYFFFGDESNTVRIYLPKKEFFTAMSGKAKAIIAYESCRDACQAKKNNSPDYTKAYTIIYTLKKPQQAILSTIMTPNGPTFVDNGDITRGWEVDYSQVINTGYFNASVFSFSFGEYAPTPQVEELSLQNYGEDFGRSEFDVWYDSFGGTTLTIALAVAASVFSEGTLAPAMLSWVSSQGARTLGTLAIKQIAEYVIAIPEILYLQDRGLNSQAAFVFILAHIPLAENLWIQPKFKIDPDIVYGQTTELLNRYRKGNFKTPADFKNYLKTLPDAEREMMEKVFKITGEQLVENPNLFRKSFATELNALRKKISRGDLVKAQKAFDKITKTYRFKIPTKSQQLLKTAKVFGSIMIPAFGINYGLTEIIQNYPITNDPAKLGQITTALATMGDFLIKKEQDILDSKIKEYQSKIESAMVNQDYALLVEGTTKIMQIYDDMNKVMSGTLIFKENQQVEFVAAQGKITSEFVGLYIGFLTTRALKGLLESLKKGIGADSNYIMNLKNKFQLKIKDSSKIYTTYCSGIVLDKLSPQNKKESCDFRDWMLKTYPNYTFEDDNLSKKLGPLKLTPCANWEKQGYSDNFYIAECGYKFAWVEYGGQYLREKKSSSVQSKNNQPTPKKI